MLLSLANVQKAFGEAGQAGHQQVLKSLDLEVAEGEALAITGPSGSGKSTLLNIIGGLERADTGSLIYKGRDLLAFSQAELNTFRNREVGFVFQFHHLLPQLSLLENVLLPTLVDTDREQRAAKRREAEELMERVGIAAYQDKRPAKVSGGECQRAAVVRAIINGPSLLLADEPTGALDGENVDRLAELFLELNREKGLALVLVTHSLELAGKMGRVLELREGKLL